MQKTLIFLLLMLALIPVEAQNISYERVFVTDYQQYKKIKVQKSILYEMR